MTHVSFAVSYTVVQSVSEVSSVERCVHLQYFPKVCVMESAVQNFVKSTIRVEGRVRAIGSLLNKKQTKTKNPEKDSFN